MSRYTEGDWDDEYAALHQGRWEHNARVALKGKRGRKALAELREALLALPEKRLIGGALCTVGGVDKRIPPLTDGDVTDKAAELIRVGIPEDRAREHAEWQREDREADRKRLSDLIGTNGEGVCLIGAYLWHKRVRDGIDPAEAFGELPTVDGGSESGGDPLHETARLGEDAGLTYTLASELAYKNDETFRDKTPEERYAAFLAWIDAELGETAGSAS